LSKGCQHRRVDQGGLCKFLIRENTRAEFGDRHGHVKPGGTGNRILRDCHAEQEINLLALTFLDHKAPTHLREEPLCEV